MLPESKKVQENHSVEWRFWYVSWCLPTEDLCLDTIWAKYEDFCRPQANEVRARFDLLTNSRQGNRSVNEWYNAVQAQVYLVKYPPETASILHRDIFWFFLKDEDFVSKTINECSVDLQKFPASKENGGIKGYCMSYKVSCTWPSSGPNESDETSENGPHTKQVQEK